MGLFRLENDMLVIDKDETRAIPEFRAILERDKGSKGDNDGRKKFRAFKEFYYIYLISDLESWINKAGLNDKEKHKNAIKDCGLEETFKPDDEIKAAIAKYQEVQLATLPALSTLSTILKGLKVADKISQSIIENMETVMENHKIKKQASIGEGNPLSAGDDLVVAQNLVSQLNQLMEISIKIPKTIETLEKIEDRLAKDKSGVTLGRGGKEIGNRADPK